MIKRLRFCLLLTLTIAAGLRAADERRAVLLVSIDGLRPDCVLEADRHGLKIPQLRALVREGAHASGVRGVLPTSTYPSHTTLVTGVSPARHGIFGNKPFGSAVKDLDVWFTYAWDIRVPTLWDAATRAGYVVGSVSWPVTVGATSIRYNVPEYNLTRTPEDVKLTRAAATPGLMAELEKIAGPYRTQVADATGRDRARTRYAVEMIRRKHPRFLTVHLAATDHIQHRDGPFSAAFWLALEEIDGMLGELREAIRAEDPRAVICVVSDHGFAPVTKLVALDAAFVKAGLITLKGQGATIDAAGVADWIARPWLAGGSAAIVMKDPHDAAMRAKVKALLDQLASDPANGIAAILDKEAINQAGGAPTAEFWVDLRPGFMATAALQQPFVSVVSPRGTHGYVPTHPEMAATFIIAGEGVAAGRDLGSIDMRSIAPTLAKLMNAPLPTAELPPLPIFSSTE